MQEREIWARCTDHQEALIFQGVLRWFSEEGGATFGFDIESPLIQDHLFPHHKKYKSHDHNHFDLFNSQKTAKEEPVWNEDVGEFFEHSIGFLIISTANYPMGFLEVDKL